MEKLSGENFVGDTIFSDFLVIGGGLAGLYCALRLAESGSTSLITKEDLTESSSYLAQGGIAAALKEPDNPDQHLNDTLSAGAGLSDLKPVHKMVLEAPKIIRELKRTGIAFDASSNGEIMLSREGAHTYNRVLRVKGDATGKALTEHFTELIRDKPQLQIYENHRLLDLYMCGSRCCGAFAFKHSANQKRLFTANAVILATGGAGHIFSETSNSESIIGEGVFCAYNAGAHIKDIEFFQFHPTVLMHEKSFGARFLISEALRGEGAVLRGRNGERFMPRYHKMAELAPRDIVARAIWDEMSRSNTDCVFLDAAGISRRNLKAIFPTIYYTCLKKGIDISKDYIPVAPAAHYLIGGVKTDIRGSTSLEGLFSCGEAACTGVHGANRLAANSLLETLVFGKETADAAVEYVHRNTAANIKECNIKFSYRYARGQMIDDINTSRPEDEDNRSLQAIREKLRKAMWNNAGIVRDEDSLLEAQKEIESIKSKLQTFPFFIERREIEIMADLGLLMIRAALIREESRGSHYRRDFKFPQESWRKHIIISKNRGVFFEEVL